MGFTTSRAGGQVIRQGETSLAIDAVPWRPCHRAVAEVIGVTDETFTYTRLAGKKGDRAFADLIDAAAKQRNTELSQSRLWL